MNGIANVHRVASIEPEERNAALFFTAYGMSQGDREKPIIFIPFATPAFAQ